MRWTSVHLHGNWSGEIEAGILEWGAGGDAGNRKWCHLLFHCLLEQFLALHAAPDYLLAHLKALKDPVALTQLGEDVFSTAMHFVVMVEADERIDVTIAAQEEDWVFRLVRNVGVEEAAADADQFVGIEEWVEGFQD